MVTCYTLFRFYNIENAKNVIQLMNQIKSIINKQVHKVFI